MAEDRRYPEFQYLVGRVVKGDAESKTIAGKDCAVFLVSANRSFDKDDTRLVDVTVFPGKTSTRTRDAALNVRRGDRVAMEGNFRERTVGDKTYVGFTAMSVYKAIEVEADDEL